MSLSDLRRIGATGTCICPVRGIAALLPQGSENVEWGRIHVSERLAQDRSVRDMYTSRIDNTEGEVFYGVIASDQGVP